jgi:hypothetical protein
MRRAKLQVPTPGALQELVEAVHALSEERTAANVRRYLASSRALEASRAPVPKRRRRIDARIDQDFAQRSAA